MCNNVNAQVFRDEQDIVRWKSNSQIPMPHVLLAVGVEPVDLSRHQQAREHDLKTYPTAHALHSSKSCV